MTDEYDPETLNSIMSSPISGRVGFIPDGLNSRIVVGKFTDEHVNRASRGRTLPHLLKFIEDALKTNPAQVESVIEKILIVMYSCNVISRGDVLLWIDNINQTIEGIIGSQDYAGRERLKEYLKHAIQNDLGDDLVTALGNIQNLRNDQTISFDGFPLYSEALNEVDERLDAEFKKKKKAGEMRSILGMEVMTQTPQVDPEPEAKGKANKDEGELTVEQAAIFFHYFFEFAKLSGGLKPGKKIDVIQAVTRWSRNSISNIIYDKKGGGVFRKANGDDYTTFEADMLAVRRLYEKLGLQDVAKMIDDEIEDISGNL